MKSFISLILICCVLPVIAVPIFTQDNNAQWTLDSNVTYVDQSTGNDVPALRTGSISDNGSTSVTLAFSDVGSIEFYIKTSSEGGWDKLIVDFGDGNTYEYSGENDYWQQLYWDWGDYGEHTVTLTYSKDGSASEGEDCCWIWFEEVDLLDMGGSDKDWEMSKTNPWYADSGLGEWNYNYENSKYVPYLNTHWIDEGQESWFTYAVEGLETFSFRYIVSSEENSDYLIVFVDDQEVERFSGEKWYETYELPLPDKGRHIIKWMYKKDSNGNTAGNDYACVWFEGIEKIMCDGYSMNMVYPWELDYFEGWFDGYAVKSGTIPEGAATSFSRIVDTSDDFLFRWRTSSEDGSDCLRYYVNGELKGELSGITDWNYVTVSCNVGDEITWEYSKDENGLTDGQDCGWVDFPGIGHLNNIISIFPEEDKLTVTKTIAVDMEVGRDVLRNFLDGDEGVSFV